MIWVAIIIGIILLFVFPKQAGILIGVIVVGFGVTYLYFEAEENERKKEIEAVAVTVSFNTKSCSNEFPIYVSINNGGKKIVEKVSWNIGAYTKGHSDNVVDYGYSSEYSTPYSSDKILNKGQSFGVCYKVPTLSGSINPKDLNWSVVRKSIDFKRN
jgi:hypothetical protein